MKERITSGITPILKYGFYSYFLLFALLVRINQNWKTIVFALVFMAIASIFHFTYFKDLKEVFLKSDGIEVKEKDGYKSIRFEDITKIDSENIGFFPHTIYASKAPAFTMLSSQKYIDLLKSKISNQALDSIGTSSAGPDRVS